MSSGLEKRLALIDECGLSGELRDYYLFHAARADLLRPVSFRRSVGRSTARAVILELKKCLAFIVLRVRPI
jgi:predicted RNA polymerase sigma factor